MSRPARQGRSRQGRPNFETVAQQEACEAIKGRTGGLRASASLTGAATGCSDRLWGWGRLRAGGSWQRPPTSGGWSGSRRCPRPCQQELGLGRRMAAPSSLMGAATGQRTGAEGRQAPRRRRSQPGRPHAYGHRASPRRTWLRYAGGSHCRTSISSTHLRHGLGG